MRVLALLLVVSAVAFAQNATVQINEGDVVTDGVRIRFSATDGGCSLTAYGSVQSPSVSPAYSPTEYPYNGARCRNLRDDALLAMKRDMRRANVAIGDGGVP